MIKQQRKVTLAIDRRLLVLVALAVVYGLVKVVADFSGLEVVVVPDTVESASKWPNAGGRVRIRCYEWWGLKGGGFIAERQIYVEEDDPQKTKQTRWMIIRATGPRLDKWGQERCPRPLFVDDYVDADRYATSMTILNTDLRWFDFGRIK